MDSFSVRFNRALAARNMTAAELSRISGVDEGTISNYRKGRYVPKQIKLELIAKSLDVSIAWLMGADMPMIRFGETYSPSVVRSDSLTFSEEEKNLVCSYRQLTPANKRTIRDNIDFFLDRQAADQKEA